MNNIIVSRTISMGHRLPDYDGICASPHGHNVTVTIEVETEKFLDFKKLGDDLGLVIDDFDHAMVLDQDDPFAEYLIANSFRVVLLSTTPSTENIAAYIMGALYQKYSMRKVTVQETAKYAASVGPNYFPTVKRVSIADWRARRTQV